MVFISDLVNRVLDRALCDTAGKAVNELDVQKGMLGPKMNRDF